MFGWGFPEPIFHLHFCVNVSEAARGEIRSGANTPLEVVSEAHYWRTKPVWMDKPAAHIEGVSGWQSDNNTGPSVN